jgi:hypothetical protein
VRRHSGLDVVLLVCAVGLAVATWATIPNSDGVVAWKHCFFISVIMLLALATVTPDRARCISMRLAMSGWLVAAPWLLGLEQMPAARWACWIAGLLLAVLSVPDEVACPRISVVVNAPATTRMAGRHGTLLTSR